MKHQINHKEAGFAIIITIGILSGILAIIVPLVLLNNYNSKQLVDLKFLTQGFFYQQSGKNVALWALKSPTNGTSRLQRWYQMPGTRNLPIPIKPVSSSISAGTVSIEVSGNLINAFMQLASRFADDDKPMTLGTAITYDHDGGLSISKTGSANLPSGADWKYLILGNELVMWNGNTGAGSLIRGLAGVREAHEVGTYVYALPNQNFYLRINDEVITVAPSNWLMDPSAGQYDRFQNLSVTKAHNTSLIYLDIVDSLSSGNSLIYMTNRITDERAKININTTSKKLAENMLKASVMGDASVYTTFDSQIQSTATWPRISPQSIMYLNTELQFSEYLGIESMITTYSEPSYQHLADTYSSSLPDTSLIGTTVLRQNGAGISSYSTGSSLYSQHPVNFNTANPYTIALVLESIKGITSAQATTYSKEIIKYRSGDDPDTSMVDYYNGNENPFDGFDYKTKTHYGSPEQEFRALIYGIATVAHARGIMAHVYGRHLPDYSNTNFVTNVTAPICFETGLVYSVHTSVNIVKDVSKNGQQRYKTVYSDTTKSVIKDFNNWDATSANKSIILNSTEGWNEHLSTFFKVDYRQPALERQSPNSYTLHLAGDTPSRDLILGTQFARIGTSEVQIAHVDASANVAGNVLRLMDTSLTTSQTGPGALVDLGLRISNGNIFQGSINDIATLGNTFAFTAPDEIDVEEDLAAWPGTGRVIIHDPVNGQSGIFDYTSITSHGSQSNIVLSAKYDTSIANNNFTKGATVLLDKTYTSVNNAFYETTVIRENSNWVSIDIEGKNLANNATLSYLRKGEAYTNTNITADSQTVAVGGASSDLLMVKVVLKNDTFTNTEFAKRFNHSPQVFELKINYIPQGNTRIIYAQDI